MQQVVLLRVGIDSGSGGMQGPLYTNGSFELIWIPDGRDSSETRTYGNQLGWRHHRPLADYFPVGRRAAMSTMPMHIDPEFVTFTYGDPTTPKRGLKRLRPGDLLAFYAGLCPWEETSGFRWGAEELYLVGYFHVLYAGFAPDLELVCNVQREFSENAHVRDRSVFADQYGRLLLVKGGPGSRLLTEAVRISERALDRAGQPLKVLAGEMHKHFGSFGGQDSLQRSNPRWVGEQYVRSAARFITTRP